MTDFFAEFFEGKTFDYDLEKQKLIDHMDFLKSMTVQELVLYKKHEEVQSYLNQIPNSQVAKAKIWKPADINNKTQTISEIENLKPTIRYVNPDNKADVQDWNLLRIFCHSMNFDQNPGRFLRYLVYDEVTGKYLGITSLGSDVISIACRDKWIGWTHQQRITTGRLNNSAIGTCIMATQPFGYNFLGGKLVASLLLSKEVRDSYQSIYEDVLVGITTTSLYGTDSMYNSIPYWKKMGASIGKIGIKPDDQFYTVWHQYIKDTQAETYAKAIHSDKSGPVTGVKQKILTMIFKELGMKMSKYEHGFQRGVYYAPLYTNTKEFLRSDVDVVSVVRPNLIDDIDGILNWWKPKAINRYSKLIDESRIKPETLFYNDAIGLTWDEMKGQYLGDIGR